MQFFNLDDICMDLKDLGTIAKYIYDNTLILERSTCSYKRDNFLDHDMMVFVIK